MEMAKFILVIGILGFIAGIFLVFSGELFIGIFGAISSAGIAGKSFIDLKSNEKE